MKLLPTLAAHGVTQADVVNADLSDAGLHGIIGQGLTLQGAIEAAQKDRQFGLDTRKQNLEERKQTFEEHKPIAAGFGTTLVDPTTHQPVFDGSGSGGGAAASIPAIADRITAVEGTGKNPNSSARPRPDDQHHVCEHVPPGVPATGRAHRCADPRQARHGR
jgi:hypothetical protein